MLGLLLMDGSAEGWELGAMLGISLGSLLLDGVADDVMLGAELGRAMFCSLVMIEPNGEDKII